ncbi:Subtilisin-like protease [Platanthera zijinensis]|uniref:Subtilisin-like protease n=1 Tax=Platanthera zijinensis TaxID=2320716 RepID=A0AAP0B0B9_9ASPA
MMTIQFYGDYLPIKAMGIPTATSPVDTAGHGTHTSSTAAGRFVDGASALGQAAGTAVGMAPEAHLAMYKICTEFGCAGSDILAGIDAAIEEGVDILSLSLGGSSLPFDQDPIAVGTFSAVEKGIFVSLAAGNSGPEFGTLSNEAPWMLTVGASTVDRVMETSVKLGNGEEYKGKSLYQTESISTKLLPLVYPGASGNSLAKFCFNNSLDVDVKGKIVICDRGGGMGRIQQGAIVKGAGAAGMILAADKLDGYTTVADAHVLPACHVNFVDATKIKSYINSTSSPTATILPRGTLIGLAGELPAPMVAAFSSRGMSQQSKGILKPDIIGPGVDVLAGWPALPIGPFDSPSLFNVISGTSMATPHLSGIAVLLKAVNPSWSPAAIKSAIMTTADNENLAGKPIANEQLERANLFARGAGHVNPSKANNPGFVYDIDPTEYVAYMCGLNYSDTQAPPCARCPARPGLAIIKARARSRLGKARAWEARFRPGPGGLFEHLITVSLVARRLVNCSSADRTFGVELNYPSFSAELKPASSRKVSRKVKNVGEGSSSYAVEIAPPTGVAVVVSPPTLTFKERGEELSYTVEFNRDGSEQTANYTEGYLSWISSDKAISVRSPILIHLLHV